MKTVNLVMTIFIVITLTAMIMMPAVDMGIAGLSGRESIENTSTRYSMIDTTEEYTFTITDSAIVCGGISYPIATNVYTLAATDTMAFSISSSKLTLAGNTTKYISSGVVKMEGGKIYQDGTEISGFTYTHAIVPDKDGDLCRGASGNKYLGRDSVGYAMASSSVLGVTGAKGFYSWNSSGTPIKSYATVQTAAGGSWAPLEDSGLAGLTVGFQDLTWGESYATFTMAPNQALGSNVTQISYYWIPYEIVYGSEPGLESLITIIPMLVIASLVLMAVGAVMTKRDD